jgi:hypothetical protein
MCVVCPIPLYPLDTLCQASEQVMPEYGTSSSNIGLESRRYGDAQS